MKLFVIVAWVGGILATVLILLGVISLIINRSLFGISHVVNYFHVANSLLLLGILCLLAKQGCEIKKS